MSKSPDAAGAVLIRIRTMKWHAVRVVSSSRSGVAREEAAALVATLDGIATALRSELAPETIKAFRERVERLALLHDHEPRTRGTGRS